MRQPLSELSPQEHEELEINVGVAASMGDVSNFDTIYELYKPSLLRKMQYEFRGSPPAEDLVQDTFMKAYVAIGEGNFSYQGKRSMYNWLVRIAINTGISAYRKSEKIRMRPTDFQDSPYDMPTPDDFTDAVASQEYVDTVLDVLPPNFAYVVRSVDNN